ncbi:MAG: hypothetical protein GXP55_11415, partial [Deltaproteobacteria bacterium]|nr:hypothetical protein [Deltaproteobacteria bacterium]
MTDASREESLNRMLAQAQRFAERDNFIDAVARVEHVLHQLEGSGEGLAAMRARAEGELSDYRARHAVWAEGIATRRKATVDGAAEEMARPLP